MTTKQINWARKHDWFIFATSSGSAVFVRDDMETAGEKVFTDFNELYEWAGY